MTPAQRALRARIASHHSWAATTSRRARAKSGGDAIRERIAAQVDPNGVMSPQDREKAVASAVKAHYARLGALSGQARRKASGTP
jgi:hypothetical protein